VDKRARVEAALRREAVDRVPLSLWRHYHRQDRSSEALAAATLALTRDYDLDLVKLTPSGLYAVEDWAGDEIVYPGTDHDPPFLRRPVVAGVGDWRRLSVLQPSSGALSRELRTIRLVSAGLQDGPPLLMTIFSPLTLAYKLAGDAVVEHLREHGRALHAGLETLAATTALFVLAALEAGASGFFFATQLACRGRLSRQEYEEFGVRYDLAVLEAATAARATILVLHLHGQDVFFDLSDRYPVQAVSWHNWETQPSLAAARQMCGRAFLTGLDRDLLGQGPVSAIEHQARQALVQTEGRGLILAPSCVIPTDAPGAHLQAVGDVLARWAQA
jgi:uroporphyrinogen decarboxylase